MEPADSLGRPLRNLRLSVTDRCNLRCAYCMPEEEYVWLPRAQILSFEEIGELVDAFVELGVDRLRLTGGEPLLRRDLPLLVRMLAAKPAIRDLALTTNGVLLEREAAALAEAGLHRVTVSLDTLRESTFRELARREGLDRVLAGIEAASRAGFRAVKLDTVVIRGVNEDEVADLLELARQSRAEVRFIEYMDVGGATRWSMEQVVSRAEILERISQRYGELRPLPAEGSAPAERFALPDGLVFGVIASTTAPFCHSCDRARLTADGLWLTCLYARSGLDLRSLLRGGASREAIVERIRSTWTRRTDRGAEERLEESARSPSVTPSALRRDPHLEMHTRGG
ncbi:MAG TPA: GTP 3',8-cyclase MoaA [Planctomycetota bacterium]|nr:GTP 3',8-cyclase MoaA [Planctomycetota bacterium]